MLLASLYVLHPVALIALAVVSLDLNLRDLSLYLAYSYLLTIQCF